MVVVGVTGATGIPGFKIIKLLLQKIKDEGIAGEVRAFVRPNSDKKKEIQELSSLGATVVEVDITNEKSLGNALLGVDKLIDATMNSTQNEILIPSVAKQAGVKHLIWNFGSKFWRIPENIMPILDDKRKVLESERTSGITWTHINTGFFMEYFFSNFDASNGVAYTIEGTPPLCVTHSDDIARYTSEIVFDPQFENKNVDIYSTKIFLPTFLEDLKTRYGVDLRLNSKTVEDLWELVNNDISERKRETVRWQALLLEKLGAPGFEVEEENNGRKLISKIDSGFVDPIDFFGRTFTTK